VPTPQFWVRGDIPCLESKKCPVMYEVVTKSDSFNNYFFKIEYDFSGMFSIYQRFLIPTSRIYWESHYIYGVVIG
jgi:hypothetical protein